MPEHEAVRTTAGEGVDRVVAAAPRDLTVREAILAAAELNSDVPIPRGPAAAGKPSAPAGEPVSDDDPGRSRVEPAAGQRGAEAGRSHG